MPEPSGSLGDRASASVTDTSATDPRGLGWVVSVRVERLDDVKRCWAARTFVGRRRLIMTEVRLWIWGWGSTVGKAEASASAAEPSVVRRLDQEPKKGDEAAPSDKRERDDEQQSLSPPYRDAGSLRLAAFACLAVTQITWLGALVYFGHRLLF